MRRPPPFLLIVLVLCGCQKAIPIKAVQVKSTHVETTVSSTTAGTVEAVHQAVLTFGSPGRVREIRIRAGTPVKGETLLARQENEDLVRTLRNAGRELNRVERLTREKLSSRAALDEALQQYEIARANLLKTEIRAPFDGLITEVNLQLGETSQLQFPADKPPVRIVDQNPRIIKGNIDEVDLPRIHPGAAARVKILAVRPQPYPATVTHVVPFVSTTKEQERTAKVELRLKDETILLPVGSSAEIEIIVATKDQVLALPSRSILGAGASRNVYRVQNDRIRKVPITVGIGNYDRTEISDGLQAGDWVVLPGDEELLDDMKVKVEQVPWS